jgi:hypothetical protein
MLSHNHARKNNSMCFVSILIFKLKNGFVDLFKKSAKCHWGKIGINKKYEGQKGNKKCMGQN